MDKKFELLFLNGRIAFFKVTQTSENSRVFLSLCASGPWFISDPLFSYYLLDMTLCNCGLHNITGLYELSLNSI